MGHPTVGSRFIIPRSMNGKLDHKIIKPLRKRLNAIKTRKIGKRSLRSRLTNTSTTKCEFGDTVKAMPIMHIQTKQKETIYVIAGHEAPKRYRFTTCTKRARIKTIHNPATKLFSALVNFVWNSFNTLFRLTQVDSIKC